MFQQSLINALAVRGKPYYMFRLVDCADVLHVGCADILHVDCADCLFVDCALFLLVD